MKTSDLLPEGEIHFPGRRPQSRGEPIWERYATVAAELKAALAREQDLLREKGDLLRHEALIAQEFEHRLVNSLQLVVSLLSMQSQSATTEEATTQLLVAARRVASIGRVHRRLHMLDHRHSVELKRYLQGLCEDLSALLFNEKVAPVIAVTGVEVKLPATLGVPLGFIVNELITNSVKYAKGRITVHIETSQAGHLLSVADEGPGLPATFELAGGSGLGIKIVRSLVKQIGGTMSFGCGDHGRGARFIVTIPLQS
jgi:two-component system, sensor histidine kinase PdtaS